MRLVQLFPLVVGAAGLLGSCLLDREGELAPCAKTQCGDICADLSVDPAHCGACDQRCGSNEQCTQGSCVPCEDGLSACGGKCVDVLVANLHCGACDAACPSGAICSSGGCECAGGQLCGEACADTDNDSSNCGECGVECGPLQNCVSAICQDGCEPGSQEACYTGPANTEDTGLCKGGTWTCNNAGTGFENCIGEITPVAELCANGLDEDCDGTPDQAPCLEGTPIVRYFLDEASSGQLPMEALDAVSPAFNLDLTYSPELNYGGTAPHQGLVWTASGADGRASAPLNGSKLLAALSGSTTATIELVFDISAHSAERSRLFHVGDIDNQGEFSLSTGSDVESNQIQFWVNNIRLERWPFTFPSMGNAVTHLVFDSSNPDAEARLRFFLNGVEVTKIDGVAIALDETIAIPAGQFFVLGNREIGARSFQGSLNYASVYAEALGDAVILANAQALIAADDL